MAALSFRTRASGQQSLQRSRRSGNVRQLRIDVDRLQLLNLLEQRLRARARQLEVVAEPLPRSGKRRSICSGVVSLDSCARCEQLQLQMLTPHLRFLDSHDAA